MSKQGYIITIVGNKFEKEKLFYEKKPSDEAISKLIIEHKGVKAYITQAEVFVLDGAPQ